MIFIRFNSKNKEELSDLFKIWEEVYPNFPLPRRIKLKGAHKTLESIKEIKEKKEESI